LARYKIFASSMGPAKFRLSGYRKAIATHVSKERIFNFGGNVLNFLFGTATSAKLQTLHQVAEGVELQQSAITHSLEH
jgi:hypothetical protein